MLITEIREASEYNLWAALNNRLTLTKYRKITILTIPNSKLLCSTYNLNILTISNKYTRLTCCNKHPTKPTSININSSSTIKQPNITFFTITNLKLFHNNRHRQFNTFLMPSIFKFELISFSFSFVLHYIYIYIVWSIQWVVDQFYHVKWYNGLIVWIWLIRYVILKWIWLMDLSLRRYWRGIIRISCRSWRFIMLKRRIGR